LGICYEKGLGVKRNLGEAMRCYQQSAALGNEPAQKRLQTLFSMEEAGNMQAKVMKFFLNSVRCDGQGGQVVVAPGLFVISASVVKSIGF
jgi:TPR repeat protein